MAEFGAKSASRNRVTSSDLWSWPIRMLYSRGKANTRGFYLSCHSSNSIKNWLFQIKFYLPYPQMWRHLESRRRALIIEYLPCCQWSERSPWFLWCPREPSIQMKWETAWHSLACKWPLAPGVHHSSAVGHTSTPAPIICHSEGCTEYCL